LSIAAVRALSIAGLLACWAAAAALDGDSRILPGPWVVLPRIWTELIGGDLLFQLRATLLRVVAAFVLAMSMGIAFGLLMGRRPTVDRWLDPWLVVFLNLPALVVIVLCYLWIGLNEVAAVAAVAINKIPTVTVMLREGARAMDPSLDAVAKVFRMGAAARLRHVVIPQLAPHIASAARSGIALIWKIVLVVEFLGRSSGIGFKIHLYFQLFDVAMVLVYALAFIVVMLAIEALVLQPLETRARAWRTA
jgi:NitT/TauT family transport system permease protein